MATFEAIQQRVSKRLKDPSNVDISVSDVAATINDAIRFWSTRRFSFNTFKETVVLTEGDPSVILINNPNPTEIFIQGGMVIDYASTRWEVTKVSSEEYDAMNTQVNGIPYAYTYRNGGYEVYYYPSSNYDLVVRGLKRYADLINNTDTNDFTDNAVDLIAYEALARLYAEFRQDDKMEAYYSARTKNEYRNLQRATRQDVATGRITV